MNHDDSTFNEATFATKGIRLANWMDEARQSGDLRKHRGRAEAVIAWLEKSKATAPPEWVAKINLTCAEIRQCVRSLPKPEKLPLIPDFSAVENIQSDAELMRQEGVEATKAVESSLQLLPAGIAQDIAYCLNATRGLEVQDHRIQEHHLFVFAFRGCLAAIRQNNPPDLLLNVERMNNWGSATALNQGFRRDELLHRIKNITEALLQDSSGSASVSHGPSKPSGPGLIGMLFRGYRMHRSVMSRTRDFEKMMHELETIRFF